MIAVLLEQANGVTAVVCSSPSAAGATASCVAATLIGLVVIHPSIGRDSLATEHPLSIEANNPRKLDCYVWEWDVISLSRSSHDTGMCTGDLITNNSSNNT